MPYLPSGEASSSDPIYSHNRPPTPTIATAASVAPTGRRAQDKDTVLGRLPPSGRKLLRGHMDLGKLAVFSVAAVAVFVWHVGPVMCEEVENEREFSYESGAENGPEHWGDIHKDWEACGKGRMQSPIDLSDERVQVVEHLGRLRRAYRPAHATMMNRGHDIMLKWAGGAGAIWINGTEYVLKQMHWHSPSEHTIDGKRYAMETHMVHESADNRIAVVGILYTFGRPDSFLTEMEEYIRAVRNIEDAEEDVGVEDPRHVKRGSRKYYRYLGSLTTPPCTEGVVWTIVKKVRTVSREQVRLLRDAVNDEADMNARPTQATNDRPVRLYRPRTMLR